MKRDTYGMVAYISIRQGDIVDWDWVDRLSRAYSFRGSI